MCCRFVVLFSPSILLNWTIWHRFPSFLFLNQSFTLNSVLGVIEKNRKKKKYYKESCWVFNFMKTCVLVLCRVSLRTIKGEQHNNIKLSQFYHIFLFFVIRWMLFHSLPLIAKYFVKCLLPLWLWWLPLFSRPFLFIPIIFFFEWTRNAMQQLDKCKCYNHTPPPPYNLNIKNSIQYLFVPLTQYMPHNIKYDKMLLQKICTYTVKWIYTEYKMKRNI